MSEYNFYINEIKRTIKVIENSIKGYDFNKFVKDGNLIDASAMRLQIIGESAKKLPKELKKDNEELWKSFEKIRDIISHAYRVLNKKVIWGILIENIPKLKEITNNIK